jgi:predicted dehydrogenase
MAGLGAAGVGGHLPALETLQDEGRVTIVGAADPDDARRALVGQQRSSLALFAHASALLDASPVDVLVVATEPSAHVAIAALAIARGVHVVCEKPLTAVAAEHDLLARAVASGDLALVLVEQYRFAKAWWQMAWCARVARLARCPFSMTVDIDRDGVDRRAVRPWREDVRSSGGLLGDHAVHFLGLARSLCPDVEPLAASRTWDGEDREQLTATVRVGSGTMRLRASTTSSARRTRVALRIGPWGMEWVDDDLVLAAAGRVLHRRRTGALSDRRHVDALYLPLYRDILDGLDDPAWRRRRTTETLAVSRVLLALLDMARHDDAQRR